VTANLTVLALLPSLTGADVEPAEVGGQPITAAHVRQLLEQLDAVCPGGLQAPSGGSLQIAVTDADGALLATAGRPELERIARRGCPDHPTGLDGACRCSVLAAPARVDRLTTFPRERLQGAGPLGMGHLGSDCADPGGPVDQWRTGVAARLVVLIRGE
jgi:hypothetical protein